MEALTVYSKYLGQYERWQAIRKGYSLKWTNGDDDSLQPFQRFFNSDSLDDMLQRIKEMVARTPVWIGKTVKFSTLTSLRCMELLESIGWFEQHNNNSSSNTISRTAGFITNSPNCF
jgi:hypothetical protein